MDVKSIRKDFPILSTKMNGKPLVYLDNAATSQKPVSVIDRISEYYRTYNANIHRGIYKIAEEATEEYIKSKNNVAKFINAEGMEEIIYTKNTTESINLVALSWGSANIKKGDHILITEMEHHSNLVPWQLLAKRNGAILDYVKLDKSRNHLDIGSLEEQLEKDPKIVAVTQVSNVLGTINDVKSISKKAHKHGAKVLVDGAQSAPHMPINVKSIDCDFFAFSSHKMLGPTGIGVLYAKREILEGMSPIIGGGDMISTVDYYSCTWNELPWKFEAGTSNIADAIGFGAAIDYLNKIGMENIHSYEQGITKYALQELSNIKNVKIFGPGYEEIKRRSGVISFGIGNVHAHDIAQVFDSEGIAIRAGHHCAMPLVTNELGQSAVARMSFYIYNTKSEFETVLNAIRKVKKIFMVD
ncbi:MAG: aminotransferase class V-fold PLP-dependent enzyme [Candidatus Micrarchaeia archaeon]